MKFYYLADAEIEPIYTTLDAAKRDARHIAANSYHDVVVEQVDVPTDRANVWRLANNMSGTMVTLRAVYTAKAKLKRAK
jgi:hypothetical protein